MPHDSVFAGSHWNSPINRESLRDYITRLYPEVICHRCPKKLSPQEKVDMSYNSGTGDPRVHPLCEECLELAVAANKLNSIEFTTVDPDYLIS